MPAPTQDAASNSQPSPDATGQTPKKPYHRPVMTEYSITDRTQNDDNFGDDAADLDIS